MANQSLPVLPPIDGAPNADQAPTNTATEQQPPVSNQAPIDGPDTKDLLIGGGILLVMTVIFIFIRQAVVNFLVGHSMKRSPNNAGLAGSFLFGGLFFASAAVLWVVLDSTQLSLRIAAGLGVAALICFVLTIWVAQKK